MSTHIISTHGAAHGEARRWAIIVTMMAATLMQVLDSTIANVALPHMQAALGATPESISWVLTSYIVMSAIATPLTGWLEGRMGRRNLFFLAIGGFTASSVLCALSTSLEMMVIARSMQGISGAFIAPLAQSSMLDVSPREKHGQVMAVLSMGVMVGPIMGPILGGWLTENYDWRWVFYINVPVGIGAIAGVWFLLDDSNVPARRFDAMGFAYLAVALTAFQLMLDRGPQNDWFDSPETIVELGVAVAMLWMFVVHSITSRNPLLPPALFRDANFLIATGFTMFVTGIGMSGPALAAPMLQRLFGYDAFDAGAMMVPRGIGALAGMLAVGRITRWVDSRICIAVGLTGVGLSLWMMTGFDLLMDQRLFVISSLVQGVSMGLAFLPLAVMAFTTLPPNLRTEGAAFYALMRNLGGSVTISMTGALLTRNLQTSHSDLTAHVTSLAIPLPDAAASFAPIGAIGAMIDAEINRQAMMIAYLDDYWLLMWGSVILVPFVLVLRKPSNAQPQDDMTILHE